MTRGLARATPKQFLRLATLPAREIMDLLIAQRHLCLAWWIVRRRRTGRLLRPISAPTAPTAQHAEQRIASLATAIDRVARVGLFRPTCLVRSVALERLVDEANAGAAIVKVGVLRRGDELLAHAWIELGGRVVGDEPAFVRQFTPLHGFSALAQ